MALEKRRRRFFGFPVEVIRYVDVVDFLIKLAYYKQRASKIAMLRQIVPSIDDMYQ